MHERTMKRYQGELNRLNDLCRCQISYNILLENIHNNKRITPIQYAFPESKINDLNSLLQQHNECLEKIEIYKTKLAGVGCPNGRQYVCKIYNRTPFQDQKLTWIEKENEEREKLQKIKIRASRFIESLMNYIVNEMSGRTYFLLEQLAWEEQMIVICRDILFLSYYDMEEILYLSRRTIHRKYFRAMERMVYMSSKSKLYQPAYLRKKCHLNVHVRK